MATQSEVVPRAHSHSLSDAAYGAHAADGGHLRVLKYVSDSVGAAGSANINLAAAQLWGHNQVKIHQIVVAASASVDFDIELYPDDQFTAKTRWYGAENNNLHLEAKDLQLFYVDMDLTGELHLKIVNTDAGNASTFTIYIVYSPVA